MVTTQIPTQMMADLLEPQRHDLEFVDTKINRKDRKKSINLAPIPTSKHWWSPNMTDKPLVSPKTYAVGLLEEISQDIMARYPDVFQSPFNNLMNPVQERNEICFEMFTSAVRNGFNLRITGVISAIWNKLSIMVAVIKEVVIAEMFNNDMMDVIVEEELLCCNAIQCNVIHSTLIIGHSDMIFEQAEQCTRACLCSAEENYVLESSDIGRNEVWWITVGLILPTLCIGFLFHTI